MSLTIDPPVGDLELVVRDIRIEDIPAVFALGELVFTAEDSSTLYRTWDDYCVVDAFSGSREACLVATLGERVVGFALGSMIEKRASAWKYGYLEWLAVDPADGGHGIGRQIVEALNERFIELGARMVLVDTDADKKDALRFFNRLGFDHPNEHVYLSLNLTSLPEYKRIRARMDKR